MLRRSAVLGLMAIGMLGLLPRSWSQLQSHIRRHSFVAGEPIPVYLSAAKPVDDMKRIAVQVTWLGRIIVRKELEPRLPIKTKLIFPALRPGVVANARLGVQLLNAKGGVITQWSAGIYVFSKRWLDGRREALKKLDVTVLSPDAPKVVKILGNHGIVSTSVPDAATAHGDWLVCYRCTPGILENLIDLAFGGTSVLMIQPQVGQVAVPWDRLDDIELAGQVSKLDPRLDGEVPGRGFELAVVGGKPGLRFAPNAHHRWFSARVNGGGRIVICGMDLIAEAGRHPAPMRIFELLFFGKPNIFPHMEETE